LGFLAGVRERMKIGAYLLVVDSASDFSLIQVGTKQYMVYQVLDQIQGFKSILSTDSRWYRMPSGLSYPLKLHNQRYYVRLYRKY